MIPSLTDMLFGCWHTNHTFPQTPKDKRLSPSAARITGSYVVCLECGQEFPYDLSTMRVVRGTTFGQRLKAVILDTTH